MRSASWLVCISVVIGCDAGAAGPGQGGGEGVDAAAPRSDGDLGAPCPWGAALAGNAGVGLAAAPHANGPTADEQQVLSAMNARRTGPPLVWNSCLADLARGHSVDMMTRGYFGHGSATAPQMFMIGDRVAAAGLSLTGHPDEDLLTGDLRYYLGSDITHVVTNWMTDDHALPILHCAEVGVAISSMPYMDTTIVWVTADFRCP